MERLTRATVKVDETAAKYMAAPGSIPADLRIMNDRLLDLVLNGPTLNGVNKDVLRQLIRQLYAALMPYEDTGLEPEQIVDRLAKAKVTDILCAELEKAFPPCKVGDTVWVDVRTLPYHYLHPADGCGDFARCEIVSIVNTGQGTYLKLRALYPSRAGRRDYLRYRVGAIGKTVFLTREEAERALEGGSGDAG